MKSNPLTANRSESQSRSCDACPPGRARLATTRRAIMRLLGAFAVLLLLAPLASGQALGSDCGTSYQISHSNASCLDASWLNLPYGVSWSAQNKCPDYGDVTVLVDLENTSDKKHELTDSTRWEGKLSTSTLNGISVNGISCCIDESDLCKKSQVEANSSDQIDHYNSSDNTWTTVSVATHQERYEHCEDNSTSVYCTNDPEGDAFTAPQLCRMERCTVSHCWSHWTASDAAPECRDESMTFDETDIFSPSCTVAADCLTSDGITYSSASGSAAPFDMDEMENCEDGTIDTEC